VFTKTWSEECGDVALVSSRERARRKRKPTLVISAHASERLEQRSIGQRAIQIAIEFGEWFYAGKGCQVAYLSRRALQAARTLVGQRAVDLENLAVVISNDGTILTAYRSRRPLKHWRGGR
jgi:Domain of unknown function (DUF4258)